MYIDFSNGIDDYVTDPVSAVTIQLTNINQEVERAFDKLDSSDPQEVEEGKISLKRNKAILISLAAQIGYKSTQDNIREYLEDITLAAWKSAIYVLMKHLEDYYN